MAHRRARFRAREFRPEPEGAKCAVGGPVQTTTNEERALHDQFDVTLEDSDLLGEVELTTNLIIAATESDQPLSTAEIDRILGISTSLD
jgi:hypothetical protein